MESEREGLRADEEREAQGVSTSFVWDCGGWCSAGGETRRQDLRGKQIRDTQQQLEEDEVLQVSTDKVDNVKGTPT